MSQKRQEVTLFLDGFSIPSGVPKRSTPSRDHLKSLIPFWRRLYNPKSQRARHKVKRWRSTYWWSSSALAAGWFHGSAKQSLQPRRDFITPERQYHSWSSELLLPTFLYRLSITSNDSLGPYCGPWIVSKFNLLSPLGLYICMIFDIVSGHTYSA